MQQQAQTQLHSLCSSHNCLLFYLQEKDGIDGQDLLDIAEDADELRHYFPQIKERLKLKKLQIAETKQDKNVPLVSHHFSIFRAFIDACSERGFLASRGLWGMPSLSGFKPKIMFNRFGKFQYKLSESFKCNFHSHVESILENVY